MKTVILGLTIGVFLFLLNSCGNNSVTKKQVPDKIIQNSNYTDTFVYDKNSPYKDVLKKCIAIKDTKDSCSLKTLPLLMQESSNPTKKQIMQRVVVSHKWMGDRFAQMLDILPSDIKKLLAATTAIVIDDDVIPSYYWTGTGAIYLDARYLWLTPKEAKTITKKQDYRSDYGKDLKFLNFLRYVKDNNYAFYYYNLDSNITRSLNDIKYAFARLLYHELAHANDFTPANIIKSANKNDSIVNILNSNKAYNSYISTKLYKTTPLESNELKKIGQILYHGKSATAVEKAYSANEIGEFFDEDRANALYSYSTQYEDIAMLFESVMMKYHYNIQRDLAFLPKPNKKNNLTCSDYIVSWGKRDRVADEQVKQRALFVTKSILPNEANWDDFFANNLSNSIELKRGKNWCDSIDLSKNQKLYKKLKSSKLIKENIIPPYL